MENKIRLEVVTPYGPVIAEDYDEVTAVGTEGEFGVLAGHANLVTNLQIGILQAKKGANTEYFFLNSGYAEVTAERLIILADSAERAEDINLERALEAKRRAEERLKQDNIDFARATAALQRASTRIALASKK